LSLAKTTTVLFERPRSSSFFRTRPTSLSRRLIVE
jgi:hypothetical protein